MINLCCIWCQDLIMNILLEPHAHGPVSQNVPPIINSFQAKMIIIFLILQKFMVKFRLVFKACGLWTYKVISSRTQDSLPMISSHEGYIQTQTHPGIELKDLCSDKVVGSLASSSSSYCKDMSSNLISIDTVYMHFVVGQN